MRSTSPLTLLSVFALAATFSAQDARVDFDAVSIKRNTSIAQSGGARTLPDGTEILVNQPIRSIILRASPVQTREVDGLPNWAATERYDITLKPPPGTTPAQRRQMMQRMFADRMKLGGRRLMPVLVVDHIERPSEN